MNILGRLIIGAILTTGMWYFYNKNVLSQLDVEAQMEEFEEYASDDYDPDDYEEDKGYAYDEYDTGGGW